MHRISKIPPIFATVTIFLALFGIAVVQAGRSPAHIETMTSLRPDTVDESDLLRSNTITITAQSVDPPSITVTVGDQVTWINKTEQAIVISNEAIIGQNGD